MLLIFSETWKFRKKLLSRRWITVNEEIAYKEIVVPIH
jgi:hypothetical protein